MAPPVIPAWILNGDPIKWLSLNLYKGPRVFNGVYSDSQQKRVTHTRTLYARRAATRDYKQK